jgi:DNA modification methylase
MNSDSSVDEVKPLPPELEQVEIPKQTEFYKLPVRFGTVPVDEAPLGWEVVTRERQTKITRFQHAYPTIRLPFQQVQRVEFGHAEHFSSEISKNPKLAELLPSGANRLFFGDCLHVMRQLPSNSIDLIYLDPPFFSGRNYNVIFGDKNEVRSFNDIWEGGMPGYLVWLNARLYEMKRLLTPTGSVFVNLDWHAAHYVKVELDKIFGNDCFQNEIIWFYRRWPTKSKAFQRMHDNILFYTKNSGNAHTFKLQYEAASERTLSDYEGKRLTTVQTESGTWVKRQTPGESAGVPLRDVWEIKRVHTRGYERIGYPTQKPIELLQRIIEAASRPGDVVADFFMGGGSFIEAAMGVRMFPDAKGIPTKHVDPARARRWIGCDQSRIAVAITADRITRVAEEKIGKVFPIPDFTVEHWGIYEIPKLEGYSFAQFKEFVVRAFGGKPESVSPYIHGTRHGIPLYVGKPLRTSRIEKNDVVKFAETIFKERRSNFGTMLAWNFGSDAKRAAEILAARENKRIDFVRLNLVRIESDEFREHARSLHRNYGELLSFVQPPEVRMAIKKVGKLDYEFDVSESISLNKDGVLANVQWDFDYRGRFKTTPGYAFLRDKETGRAQLVATFKFASAGKRFIACSVQDDQGGEKTVIMEIDVR